MEFGPIASLCIYIVAFSCTAILIHLAQNKSRSATSRKLLISCGLAVPTLLGGLRYGVGADFFSYASKIEGYAQTLNVFEFYDKFGGMETATWLIGNLSLLTTGNSLLFFIVTSFLTVLFLYLGVKNFGIKNVGIAIFLLMMVIYPQALSGVRQGVAIAMSFYAFSFIPQQRPKYFVGIILAAGVLFHFSALAMLVVYPLYQLIIKQSETDHIYKKRLLILGLIAPPVAAAGLYLIQFIPVFSKYATYYTSFLDKFGYMIGSNIILPELFALVFLIVFYRRIVLKSTLGKFSLMTTIIMVMLNVAGYIIPLIGRFGDYFMPVFLITFANLPSAFSSIKSKKASTVLVIVWAILFFIGAFFVNGSGSIFPYHIR